MNKYIKALVKVTSQYEYAQNFRDGKLWMNELRFFTKCEQKELGDAKEARGTTFWKCQEMCSRETPKI